MQKLLNACFVFGTYLIILPRQFCLLSSLFNSNQWFLFPSAQNITYALSFTCNNSCIHTPIVKVKIIMACILYQHLNHHMLIVHRTYETLKRSHLDIFIIVILSKDGSLFRCTNAHIHLSYLDFFFFSKQNFHLVFMSSCNQLLDRPSSCLLHYPSMFLILYQLHHHIKSCLHLSDLFLKLFIIHFPMAYPWTFTMAITYPFPFSLCELPPCSSCTAIKPTPYQATSNLGQWFTPLEPLWALLSPVASAHTYSLTENLCCHLLGCKVLFTHCYLFVATITNNFYSNNYNSCNLQFLICLKQMMFQALAKTIPMCLHYAINYGSKLRQCPIVHWNPNARSSFHPSVPTNICWKPYKIVFVSNAFIKTSFVHIATIAQQLLVNQFPSPGHTSLQREIPKKVSPTQTMLGLLLSDSIQ